MEPMIVVGCCCCCRRCLCSRNAVERCNKHLMGKAISQTAIIMGMEFTRDACVKFIGSAESISYRLREGDRVSPRKMGFYIFLINFIRPPQTRSGERSFFRNPLCVLLPLSRGSGAGARACFRRIFGPHAPQLIEKCESARAAKCVRNLTQFLGFLRRNVCV